RAPCERATVSLVPREQPFGGTALRAPIFLRHASQQGSEAHHGPNTISRRGTENTETCNVIQFSSPCCPYLCVIPEHDKTRETTRTGNRPAAPPGPRGRDRQRHAATRPCRFRTGRFRRPA